jgi:ribosomal protein S2
MAKLEAVLVGRWFAGMLTEIKEISTTDDFQDPPGYFMEAYAMYLGRLKEA